MRLGRAVGVVCCLLVLSSSVGCRRTAAPELSLRPVTTTTADADGTQTVPPSFTKLRERRFSGSEFDAGRALRDARKITEFGVRPGGSEVESEAAAYVVSRLRSMGYRVEREFFELPNGKTSQNVWVSVKGRSSSRQVIVGAHFDTKPTTPGANDNASGCGVALEIARLLRSEPAAPTVKIVFFGTEEFISSGKDEHHLGSRHDAGGMSDTEVANTAAMVSLDMVGYGSEYLVRTMGKGPRTLADQLLEQAKVLGIDLEYRRDPGPTGWSDHEPYERLGIPSVWMQWLPDPAYHTMADDIDHLRSGPIEITGTLTMSFLRGLDIARLERLCDR